MNLINKETKMTVFDTVKELFMEKMRNKKKMIQRFIHLFLQQRFKLMAAMIILIAIIALKLSTPLAIGKIFDVISEGIVKPFYYGTNNYYIDFYKLREIILLLLVKTIAASVLIYVQKHIMSIVGKGIVHSLRKDVNNKLSKVPLKHCSTHERKEIENCISHDSEEISQALQTNLMKFIKSILTVIGTVILMIKINWILASICLISILSILSITAIIGTKGYRYMKGKQQSLGFLGKPTVVKFFQYVVIAGLGIVFMVQGKLSIGQIQAFFQYMNKASDPFSETTATWDSLKSALVSAERVSDILDEVETQGFRQKVSGIQNSGNILKA